MSNITNIYVCYTVMHLYVSILKVFNNNDKNILIITDHIENYMELSQSLKENKIFNEILIVDDKKISNKFNEDKMNFILFKKKLISFFEEETFLNEYMRGITGETKIYTFLDETRTSQYLMLKFKNSILVEDGKGLYGIEKINFKLIVKNLLGIPRRLGRDKSIKIIEATKPNELSGIAKKKGVKLDLEYLQNNLGTCDRDKILRVFFNQTLEINSYGKNILILTQPFSEDLGIDEEVKVNIYNDIIKTYIGDYNVYIKPHPREKTNYKEKINYEFIEIERNFPIELLNIMCALRFEKIISINSSSVDNIKYANEKIELGIGFNKVLEKEYRRVFGIK